MTLKLLFLPQNCKNYPAAGDSAPCVTRLSCNGLFSTRPKLDNFCAKNIYFGSNPLSLNKTLVAFMVAFTSADRFFKRLYWPVVALGKGGGLCKLNRGGLFFTHHFIMIYLHLQSSATMHFTNNKTRRPMLLQP